MKEIVFAPLSGKAVKLESVPDRTFSRGLLGDGMAIEPINGEVFAPFSGEIILTFPTKHAVGLRSETGLEVLIHIGIDTVHLNGEGFEVHVKEGDHVKQGDVLVTFDYEKVKKEASIITPIIITNDEELVQLEKTVGTNLIAGESTLFSATHKAEEQVEHKHQYNEAALAIVQALGGEENIQQAAHCVTRLRFNLIDEAKVDKKQLDNIELVKAVFSAHGQFQLIIGQGLVERVYQAMMLEMKQSQTSKQDKLLTPQKRRNPLQHGIQVLADIFIPILPAIIAAGLLMGINNVLVNPSIFGSNAPSLIEMYPQWADVADIIYIIANTAFTFLPALIGWSAVKRFGGNPLLGIVIGLVMVHPELLNAWDYAEAVRSGEVPTWNLFGLEIEKIGYQGQVLPVLFAAWILAKLELNLKRHVIDSLQLLVVAPLAVLVTALLTFIVIGPLTFTLGNWISALLVSIFDVMPMIGGLVYGAIYAPLVITGMHHTLLAVDLQLIATTGFTFLFPILILSNIAQGSAAFAIMLAAKKDKLKVVAGTSGVSAWLGITEPAMFGINLPHRFPFIAAISGSALGGAFIMLERVAAPTVGVGGIPGFLSVNPASWLSFAIGMVIVMIVPFLITYVIAKYKLRANR